MNDDFAKAYLHDDLRWTRHSLLGTLDGLSEYDARRPLTRTGTNLLGLIKHLTIAEACYLGSIFGRPLSDRLPRFDDPGYQNRDSLWVHEWESRADVIDGYQRACRHADATVDALQIDAPGHVPWWPQPNVTLFNAMVHVLTESNRHAGHADILREQLDIGSAANDAADWAAHCARIETAARAAADLARTNSEAS